MTEHKGSRELYDAVANWDSSGLLFSKIFRWKRWGVLGVLADYVLFTTPGDIIEIGICETSIYFSELARRYNRKVYHCDIQHSVIENCKTVPGYFNEHSLIYCMSSDKFFEQVKFDNQIALAFIDGDHNYEFVKRDFENCLNVLALNGYIFMHDTSPVNKEETEFNRSGTVYKLRREIENNNEFELFTFHNTAWDAGLSIIRRKIYPYNGE